MSSHPENDIEQKLQRVESVPALLASGNDAVYLFADTIEVPAPHETIRYDAGGTAHILTRQIAGAPPRRILKLHDAVAQKAVISGWNQLTGAVYDSNGRLVPDSKVRIAQNCPDRLDAGIAAAVVRKPGVHIYLGHFNVVYGHFILETIARCWALDFIDDEDARFVFLKIRKYELETTGYALEFFEMMGIDPGRIDVIDADTVFDTLYVPSAVVDLGNTIHPLQIEACRRLAKKADAGGDDSSPSKLYLSRARLGIGSHRYYNEEELEAGFAATGFDIVHPQELPIADQLKFYARASYIVGAVSSVLHNSVFAPADCTVVAFDGRAGEGGSPYTIQQQICAAIGQPMRVVDCHRAPSPRPPSPQPCRKTGRSGS